MAAGVRAACRGLDQAGSLNSTTAARNLLLPNRHMRSNSAWLTGRCWQSRGLAVLAVVHIRVVQVDKVVVAVGDHHPVRRLGAGQPIAADQHQRLPAVAQYPGQIQRAAEHLLDRAGGQLFLEGVMH